MCWVVKHKSGTVLFRTDNIETARDRKRAGWRVEMQIKIKKCREGAVIPQYATAGAACFDLCAVLDKDVFVYDTHPAIIPTGLQFEIPEGYALMIYSRSGHGFKNDVRLSNCVGVIDSDYRGELMVKLTQDSDSWSGFRVSNGDRIAQAMIIPVNQVSFEQVDTLSDTMRGDGGFGSTGK